MLTQAAVKPQLIKNDGEEAKDRDWGELWLFLLLTAWETQRLTDPCLNIPTLNTRDQWEPDISPSTSALRSRPPHPTTHLALQRGKRRKRKFCGVGAFAGQRVTRSKAQTRRAEEFSQPRPERRAGLRCLRPEIGRSEEVPAKRRTCPNSTLNRYVWGISSVSWSR